MQAALHSKEPLLCVTLHIFRGDRLEPHVTNVVSVIPVGDRVFVQDPSIIKLNEQEHNVRERRIERYDVSICMCLNDFCVAVCVVQCVD